MRGDGSRKSAHAIVLSRHCAMVEMSNKRADRNGNIQQSDKGHCVKSRLHFAW
jgi:hypothetical protein